jgi:hypothetical protein
MRYLDGHCARSEAFREASHALLRPIVKHGKLASEANRRKLERDIGSR